MVIYQNIYKEVIYKWNMDQMSPYKTTIQGRHFQQTNKTI